MREQKDQMRSQSQQINSTRKKQKFNLNDDENSDGVEINFLTHKGKKLEDIDDFKDRISNDSADQYDNKDDRRGIMNNEMVNELNFGGGEAFNEKEMDNRKKTREERHAEIMEKSKAYKLHH